MTCPCHSLGLASFYAFALAHNLLECLAPSLTTPFSHMCRHLYAQRSTRTGHTDRAHTHSQGSDHLPHRKRSERLLCCLSGSSPLSTSCTQRPLSWRVWDQCKTSRERILSLSLSLSLRLCLLRSTSPWWARTRPRAQSPSAPPTSGRSPSGHSCWACKATPQPHTLHTQPWPPATHCTYNAWPPPQPVASPSWAQATWVAWRRGWPPLGQTSWRSCLPSPWSRMWWRTPMWSGCTCCR